MRRAWLHCETRLPVQLLPLAFGLRLHCLQRPSSCAPPPPFRLQPAPAAALRSRLEALARPPAAAASSASALLPAAAPQRRPQPPRQPLARCLAPRRCLARRCLGPRRRRRPRWSCQREARCRRARRTSAHCFQVHGAREQGWAGAGGRACKTAGSAAQLPAARRLVHCPIQPAANLPLTTHCQARARCLSLMPSGSGASAGAARCG